MIFRYTERFDMTAIFLDIIQQNKEQLDMLCPKKLCFPPFFPQRNLLSQEGLTINIETFHGCFMKARGIYK